MKRIAIIDDGVFGQYKNIIPIKKYFIRDGLIIDDFNILFQSHGGYCARIIDNYLQSTVELISLNVMDVHKSGNVSDFILAIECCMNEEVDIINISCGTADQSDFEQIEHCFQRFNSINNIIIAAQSNRMEKTCPAFLPQVIGVRCDPKMIHNHYRIIEDKQMGIDVEASGVHYIKQDNKKILTRPCNSFANACVTSIIANITLDNNSVKTKFDILKKMKERQKNE